MELGIEILDKEMLDKEEEGREKLNYITIEEL